MKVNLSETILKVVNQFRLVKDRYTAINCQVLRNAGKFVVSLRDYYFQGQFHGVILVLTVRMRAAIHPISTELI